MLTVPELPSKLTVSNVVMPVNASEPIAVMLEGMITCFSAVSLKAFAGMTAIPVGISTSVRPVPSNAPSPSPLVVELEVVSLRSPMSADVSREQPLNASVPTDRIPVRSAEPAVDEFTLASAVHPSKQ